MDVQSLYTNPFGSTPGLQTTNNYYQALGVIQRDYATLGEIVAREILPLNPRIIAWGEVHFPRGASYTSTVARFARENVPLLAGANRRQLFLDIIPRDDVVEVELARFYADPSLTINPQDTPELNLSVEGADRQGYIELFNEARRLGVRIYGAGMTIAQANATIRRHDFLGNAVLEAQAAIFTREGIEAVMPRFNSGTIDIYTGAVHNDRYASLRDRERRRNFGEALRQRYGPDYVAVDLRLPYNTTQPELFPTSGVRMIRDGFSFYLLFAS